MSLHLNREIENLKSRILKLGSNVEQAVQKATVSIKNRDAQLAQSVIDNDIHIDDMEVDIEEECLKILALHQPVAIDLRFIISVLKINSDLERIGDLAVNIAKRAPSIDPEVTVTLNPDYIDMAKDVQVMLKKSLDALVNIDANLASQVRKMDDNIDDLNRNIRGQIKAHITSAPENIDSYIQILGIPRDLERIGDHAVNIAEDVIYMSEGKIVRHNVHGQ
ncbi:MAG: phosphate signaling complex protein PhoU [Sedimentisphaeraceae bacterium JB056]